MRAERTLEKIAAAFAEAVGDGNLEEAEGWLAVARLTAGRETGASTRAFRAWFGPKPTRAN